jgi:two-component system, OmpR family, sensor kinase
MPGSAVMSIRSLLGRIISRMTSQFTGHFLRLYVLLVLALVVVMWSQQQLWHIFSGEQDSERSLAAAPVSIAAQWLQSLPVEHWRSNLKQLSNDTGYDFELLNRTDIAGMDQLAKRDDGVSLLNAGEGEWWYIKPIDSNTVLVFKSHTPQRSRLEWALALLFYAAIALVMMIWLWPLTRDLRTLERATASFGNRNWQFNVDIAPRSQVFSLAQTFRKMAARIDGLIASHRDLSNAVAHEIKTPLARMQFEIELARDVADPQATQQHLINIRADIATLNKLVHATLEYAVLERADMVLNIGAHDFTTVIPALTERVNKDMQGTVQVAYQVAAHATAVRCDAHLMETLLSNLLYNAARYAKQQVCVRLEVTHSGYRLEVGDDGPGIAESDRQRVFESFVQLHQANVFKANVIKTSTTKTGFGLGLAIVKRIAEWHHGEVRCTQSHLGGAAFVVTWPRC